MNVMYQYLCIQINCSCATLETGHTVYLGVLSSLLLTYMTTVLESPDYRQWVLTFAVHSPCLTSATPWRCQQLCTEEAVQAYLNSFPSPEPGCDTEHYFQACKASR